MIPRAARAAITSSFSCSAWSQSWYSSMVKFGQTPGMWVQDSTESATRSTTASYTSLVAFSQSTDSDLRGIGSPARQALTSAFGGSASSMPANRQASDTPRSRRRMAAVARYSSSESGSSGCADMGGRLLG